MLKTFFSDLFFSGFFDEWKEQHLSEIEIFCKIINDSIITIDQFNTSLLNKSITIIPIILFPKLYWLQTFEWYSV